MSFADQSERENPPKGSSVVGLLYGSKALRDAYSSIVKLYESFVGPIHFRVISRLMGYHGIAMILEQLLHILEGQVCVCVWRKRREGRRRGRKVWYKLLPVLSSWYSLSFHLLLLLVSLFCFLLSESCDAQLV